MTNQKPRWKIIIETTPDNDTHTLGTYAAIDIEDNQKIKWDEVPHKAEQLRCFFADFYNTPTLEVTVVLKNTSVPANAGR